MIFFPAGATLVQWNRISGDLIASAHDSDIRIWDKRVSRVLEKSGEERG